LNVAIVSLGSASDPMNFESSQLMWTVVSNIWGRIGVTGVSSLNSEADDSILEA